MGPDIELFPRDPPQREQTLFKLALKLKEKMIALSNAGWIVLLRVWPFWAKMHDHFVVFVSHFQIMLISNFSRLSCFKSTC